MLRLLVLCCAMAGGVAVAQTTTGSVNPNPPAPQSAAKDDVPPGGCMPMGVTASGEIVFPLECKGFLEQHRDKDPKQEPGAAETKPPADLDPPVAAKPPADQAPAVMQPPVAVPQKSAAREEAPIEQQPEPTTEKPPEALPAKQVEAPPLKEPAAKEPEKTTAAKESEMPSVKEPDAPAAKEPDAPAPKQAAAAAPEETRPIDRDRTSKSSSLSKHAEDVPRQRSSRSSDCTNYRTYNSSSGTYRDYSGRVRACR
jgi:hypothetical protein